MLDDLWLPIAEAPRDGTVLELNGDHPCYPLHGKWEGGEWVAERMQYRLGPATIIPDPTSYRSVVLPIIPKCE